MREIKAKSHFGGLEIIKVNHSELFNDIATFIEIYNEKPSLNSSLNIIEELFVSTFKKRGVKKLAEEKCLSEKDLSIPEFLDISAYVLNEICIYFPKMQVENFWFDQVALDYFFSNDWFKVCVFMLTSDVFSAMKIQYEELISLIKDHSMHIAKYPLLIISESINQGDNPCPNP